MRQLFAAAPRRGAPVLATMILSVALLATASGAQDDDLIVSEVGIGLRPIVNDACLAPRDGQARAFRGDLGLLCILRSPPAEAAAIESGVAGAREDGGLPFPVADIEPSMGQILDADTPNPIVNVEFGAGEYRYSILFIQSVVAPDVDLVTFVVDLAQQHVRLVADRTAAAATTTVAEDGAGPAAPLGPTADECDEVCQELLGLLVEVDGWTKLGDPTMDLHLDPDLAQAGEVAEALNTGTRSIFQFYQTADEQVAGVLISRMRFPLFAAAAVGDAKQTGLDTESSLGSANDRPDLWIRQQSEDRGGPAAAFRHERYLYTIATGSSGTLPSVDDLGRLAAGLYDAAPEGATDAFFPATVLWAVIRSSLLVLGLGLLLVGVRALHGGRAAAVPGRAAVGRPIIDAEPQARQIRRRSRILIIVQLLAIGGLIVGPAVFGLSVAVVIAAIALVVGVGTAGVIRRRDRPRGVGRFVLPTASGLIVGSVATLAVLLGVAAMIRGVGNWLFTPWFDHLELSDYLAIAPERLGQLMVLGGATVTICGAVVYRLARRVGKASAKRVTETDVRPPVLYLRSFEDDRLPIPTAATSRRPFFEAFSILGREPFEETVAWQLEQFGPVIGVLPPGSDRATLGSAKESLPQAEWQPLVLERMAEASTIVVVLAETEGLAWEMEQILGQRFASKTLFVVPPVGPEENRNRWQSFCTIATGAGLVIDQSIDPGIALVVAIVGDTQTGVTAARRDEAGYRAALDRAMAVIDDR
ncbi:MAG: hypothetical protein AAF547_10300 [Actinomycetota bacterium]